MKTALSVVLFSGLAALTGCNVFEPDRSVILSVPKIDAPATVSAGSSFTVTLTVQTGGCRSFSRLEVEKSTTGVHVVPWGTDARIGNKGILCPANIVDEPHGIQIDPPFSGPYRVWVDQGRLMPVVATVQVQ